MGSHLHNNQQTMANQKTIENENAESRISAIIDEIGQQISSIASEEDVDGVIAEQEKSGFIYKQAEPIQAYSDNCDGYKKRIAELEAKLEKAEREHKYYFERWGKELRDNKNLKVAINALSAVLNED